MASCVGNARSLVRVEREIYRMAFSSWRGVVGMINPTMRPGVTRSDDDQDIEQVKPHCWNNKQVHGGDVRCVVTQEGAPPLGWRAASLDHILRDARLSDL